MNTKLILALAAIATVAAALIGVTAAQYANNTSPFANTTNRGVEPPCVTGDISQVPEWCVNATTGEPYWLQNGIQNSNADSGYCYQNGYAYGYGCYEDYENQYQHQQRFSGMYERNIVGFGGCR